MMNVPEIVRTEIAQAVGLEPVGLRVTLRNPLDFQSNRLYDIWTDSRHLIAKEYLRPDELEEAPLREYQALRLLSSLQIAPQPVFYEPSTGPLVIYEYMEGKMWDRCSVTAADLYKLSELWLKIHSVEANWLARGSERPWQAVEQGFHHQLKAYLDWAAADYSPARPAAEMCLELLEDRRCVFQELSEAAPILCFCRSDPRFANVIQRPDGQLGLVDWEDSGLRDPAREAADILMHPNQEDLLGWDEWQSFLKPYLAARSKIDPEVVARLHLYLAIFPLFWLTIVIRRGIHLASQGGSTGWTINGLPGNERLRRYLARAIAWPDMDYHQDLESLAAIEFFPDSDKM